MPISLRCPKCGSAYTLKDELAGKQVKCKCSEKLTVAAPQPPAASYPAMPGAATPPSGPWADPMMPGQVAAYPQSPYPPAAYPAAPNALYPAAGYPAAQAGAYPTAVPMQPGMMPPGTMPQGPLPGYPQPMPGQPMPGMAQPAPNDPFGLLNDPTAVPANGFGPTLPPIRRRKKLPVKMIAGIVGGIVALGAVVTGIVMAVLWLPELWSDGFATPEAAFAAAMQAEATRDFRADFQLRTPREREIMIGTMVLASKHLSEEKPEFAALLQRYGVNPASVEMPKPEDNRDKIMKELAGLVSNHEAFFAAALKQIEASMDEQIKSRFGERRLNDVIAERNRRQQLAAQAKFEDLVIDGSDARCRAVVPDSDFSLEVTFRRENGRWFVTSNTGAIGALGQTTIRRSWF